MNSVDKQLTVETQQVMVQTRNARLAGRWSAPPQIRGAVVFAHGSGSGHRSQRNEHVAEQLHNCGFGTLLFDLLNEEESGIDGQSGIYRFDVDLLAQRVREATEWLDEGGWSRGKPIGYFGASTGAAAVLAAAAGWGERIKAVVSRGGRVELAEPYLPRVSSPTLLIVGEKDVPVLNINRGAVPEFTIPVKMEIIPGASHLFEEPGALDQVARLSGNWFLRHLDARAG